MSSVAVSIPCRALSWGLSKTWAESLAVSAFWRVAPKSGAINRQVSEAALRWGEQPGAPMSSLDDALNCLAWAYLAADPASGLDAAVRASIVATLERLQVGFARLAPLPSPLLYQWLVIELPWVVAEARRVATPATSEEDFAPRAHALGQLLAAAWPLWLDAEGHPLPAVLPHASMLLASWVRCASWWRKSGHSGWTDNHREQFEAFTQLVLRLVGKGDSIALADPRAGVSVELLSAALEFCVHDSTHELSQATNRVSTRKAKKNSRSTPPLGEYSEPAGLALMRSDWSSSATRLALAFDAERAVLEMEGGSQHLFVGSWNATVSVNGRTLMPRSSWSETVWFSDEDVDYLEWSLELEEGWVLQRQALLCRESKLVFLADAVLGEQPELIDYDVELPLGPGVRGVSAVETHEVRMEGKRPLALVLPLAFPEWRAAPLHGSLAVDRGLLCGSLRASGMSLYFPLLIATDRKQLSQPFTWRRLTVADSMKVVPHDVAVGYRAQFGRRHWLFYQALASTGNRSLLGQNLAGWFVAAEMKSEGIADVLVRIEE